MTMIAYKHVGALKLSPVHFTALSVACPTCKAEVGHNCRTALRKMEKLPHVQRAWLVNPLNPQINKQKRTMATPMHFNLADQTEPAPVTQGQPIVIIGTDPTLAVDDDWAKNVCRIGQGRLCCRYLSMGPGGWACQKLSPMKSYLDMRVASGTIGSISDNCTGRSEAPAWAEPLGTDCS